MRVGWRFERKERKDWIISRFDLMLYDLNIDVVGLS